MLKKLTCAHTVLDMFYKDAKINREQEADYKILFHNMFSCAGTYIHVSVHYSWLVWTCSIQVVYTYM